MTINNTYFHNFAFFDNGASNSLASFLPSFTFPPLFNFDACFNNCFDLNHNSFFNKSSLEKKSETISFTNFEPQKLNYDFNFDYNIKPKLTNSSSNVSDTFTFTNKNKKAFSLSDYNAEAGKKLAQTALKNAPRKWSGLCATKVKNAIQECGLGKYVKGHAYKMADILRNNKNFKEISPTKYNAKDLPAGCVLVYNKGSEGYSKLYGHTEITTGDKRAVSDGITKNLRQPDAIFMPVYA